MTLAELLHPERVQIRSDLRSKKRILEEIAKSLHLAAPSVNESAIFTALINREKLGSTGLGGGVAIPHGRVRGLDTAVGAFFRIQPATSFDSSDGQPVDLVFGLLVPEQATDVHLQILRSLAERFSDDASCQALRSANNAAQLHEILTVAPAA